MMTRPVVENLSMNDHTSKNSGRGPLGGVLRLFSSIWLGVILLTLLFIYSSIGSAGMWLPNWANFLDESAWVNSYASWTQWQVRQAPGLEMTEFEWFHWWPFDLMIALICVNLTVATLRRIPLKPVNYGVWMIHTGIIILCLSSVWYFGTKIEGDAPVVRRMLTINVPGHDPVTVQAVPGNRAVAGEGVNGYLLEITDINPQYTLLSGDDEGKVAYAVTVNVISGTDQRFMRQVIAGYPEYTEDVIRTDDPQQPFARAIKALGKPLVDEQLSLSLDYAPQDHLFLANNIRKSWAIYVREKGTREWIERPVEGLPLYNDYIARTEDVWLPVTEPDATVRPLDVTVPAASDDDPIADIDLRITSYLRYAVLDERRVAGGDTLSPAAVIRLSNDAGVSRDYDLLALDPNANTAEGGRLRFVWASSVEEREQLATFRERLLTVTIPGTDITIEHPVTTSTRVNPDLEFTTIEGTDYAFRMQHFEEGLQIGQKVHTVAMVEIRNGEDTFLRWVFDDPTLNRDRPLDAEAAEHVDFRDTDTGIDLVFDPGVRPAPVTLIGGPDPGELHVQLSIRGGTPELIPATVGTPVAVDAGINLTVTRFESHSRSETRPAIVARSQRNRDAGENYAMINVDVPLNGETASAWVSFHLYPIPDAMSTLRRLSFAPTTVTLPDGRVIELILSRQRHPLPEQIVLDDFVIATHIGGFTGTVSSIRNWTSQIRFGEEAAPDQWSDVVEVSVNQPVEHEGLWYFQSQWDPPTGPRFEGDVPSQGLNYTVLGVANRNGVVLQLIGCTISVIGMIYAFYVKPYIKRRRQDAVMAGIEAGRLKDTPESASRNGEAAAAMANANMSEEDVR